MNRGLIHKEMRGTPDKVVVTDAQGLVAYKDFTEFGTGDGTSTSGSHTYPIGLTQNRTYAPVPLLRSKTTTVSAVTFDAPITGCTFQLYKGGVAGTVRSTIADINADLAAMTTTEKSNGGFLVLNFSGAAGWEIGTATLTISAV